MERKRIVKFYVGHKDKTWSLETVGVAHTVRGVKQVQREAEAKLAQQLRTKGIYPAFVSIYEFTPLIQGESHGHRQ